MKLKILLLTTLIFCLLSLSVTLPAWAKDKPLAVATTTMIYDLVQQVAGDKLEIRVILKPGTDPHLYKPVPSDAKLLADSDIVFKNGLLLEGWIDKLIDNAGGTRTVITISDGITALNDPSKKGHPDPHIWFSIPLWKEAVKNLTRELIEFDPTNKEYYQNRADLYQKKLDQLHENAKKRIATIPKKQRVMITSHDAFNYFGNEYDITVIGVQGISTESEAGSKEVSAIVKYIKRKNIPAIFVETSVNPKLIEEIANQSGAKIGGTLYGDSTGGKGSGAETLIGMMNHNVETLVKALGGDLHDSSN